MNLKLFSLLFLAVFVIGCNQTIYENSSLTDDVDSQNQNPQDESPQTPSAVDELDNTLPAQLQSCTYNSECTDNTVCVEKQCRKLDDVAKLTQNCGSVCTIREVVMNTNKDGAFTLTPGRGSYTSAGALEWKIERAYYCNGEDAFVPVLIGLRNYGKLIGEYYIVLSEGETSNVLTHPVVSSVQFELTAEEIADDCETTEFN